MGYTYRKSTLNGHAKGTNSFVELLWIGYNV